jgi:quercetin dioxygenase-like cupin family protein
MTTLTSPTTGAAPEHFMGALFLWHVTSEESGGAFALNETWARPGGEPPIHIHAREDEAVYMLEGEAVFQVGLERFVVKPGDSFVLPRGIQHGFAVTTPVARSLHVYSPGGIEEAFQALSEAAASSELPPAPAGPPPAEALEALAQTFAARGVEFVGPPLPVLLAAA